MIFIIGIFIILSDIYTHTTLYIFIQGRETKLSLNSKGTPSKLSTIDRIVNKTLLIAITAMLVVCIISMVSSIIWTSLNDDAVYLCLTKTDLDGRFTCENSAPSSTLTIFTFATLYNNFVCISMYVSLEMVLPTLSL